MQFVLHPSPPSSISSSHSGSSQSRLSFLSSSSSSTFSDISSVSSLPSPPHSGSKTHAFFASPFPTRPPSPTPAPSPPSTKTYSFFAVPSIDVSTPTIKTPTTQSLTELDSSSEPTPRPKDLVPDLSNLWLQPTPNEPTAGSIISSQHQIPAQPSPTSATFYPLSPSTPPVAQNTTLRLQKPLGHGAFSSVWLADDLSPVPLVLRSRRSLRDLRRQASLKSPPSAKISNTPSNRLSLSRAGSLRKLRARVAGTSPIRSLVDSASIDAPQFLQSSLSRASSTSSTSTTSSLASSSPRSTKSRSLTISITEPTSPPLSSGGLSRSNSTKGRLVAVKMTVRGGASMTAGEDEEREKERTRVAFVREVEVLRHISHPNITPLLTHISTATHHVLVLPYLPGGDLLALVNTDATWTRLRESVLQRMWCELCRAVGWMHGVGLVHRDIKLENILLTTEVYATLVQHHDAPAPTLDDLPASPAPLVKLTDFGLSRFVDIRSEEERARDRAARREARRAAAAALARTPHGRDLSLNLSLNGGAGARERRKAGEDEEAEDDEEEEDGGDGPLLSTRCGSEAYAAPELVTGGPAPAAAAVSRTRADSRNHAGAAAAAERKRNGATGPRPRGVYDARETDAWACGVVLYALVGRQLPFGEGVGAGFGNGNGAGVGIGRRADLGPGPGEGRMARRAWLMRIARGEYEWPEVPATVPVGNGDANLSGEERELVGRTLAASDGARRIVGRLLVRDPRKRARVAELWGDVWMGGDGEVQIQVRGSDGRGSPPPVGEWHDGEEEMEEMDADTPNGEEEEMEEEELELALAEAEEEVDEFGWLVDQDGIDDIARREVV